jgi:hypothetical protein
MRLKVVSPCPVSWESLEGEGSVRYCNKCNLHVTDLSDMPEACAIELVRAKRASGQRFCGRIRAPVLAAAAVAVAGAALSLAGCTAEVIDDPTRETQPGAPAPTPAAPAKPPAKCHEGEPDCRAHHYTGDVMLVE